MDSWDVKISYEVGIEDKRERNGGGVGERSPRRFEVWKLIPKESGWRGVWGEAGAQPLLSPPLELRTCFRLRLGLRLGSVLRGRRGRWADVWRGFEATAFGVEAQVAKVDVSEVQFGLPGVAVA